MATSYRGDNKDDNTLTCVPDDEERKTLWKKKCALCTGDYRRPKILPCKNFHTFCDDCIQHVAATWQAVFNRDPQTPESSACQDEEANMSFPCPRCRMMVQKPDEGFAENEYVKDADPEDKDTRKAEEAKTQYMDVNRPRFNSPSYAADGTTAGNPLEENLYDDEGIYPYEYDYDHASGYVNQPRQNAPPLPPRTKGLPLPRVNALAESYNHIEEIYDAVDDYLHPIPDHFPLNSGKPSSSASAADTVPYSSVVGKVPSWLPRPTEQTFKWSKAKVSSVCNVGNKVFFFGQVTEKRKEPSLKMAVFEADGRKLLKAPMTSHVTSMALLDAGQDRRLVFVQRGSPCLQWINAQDFLSSSGEVQLSDVRQVYVKNPVLSKPAPGQPLYVLGVSDEGETEVYKVLTKRSTPPLQLHYEGTVHAIDVSSDDKYVAVLGTQGRDLVIDVYERSGQKAIHVSGFSFDGNYKAGSYDICFYIPKGAQQEIGEVLMVAERNNSCLRLLDHVTNCRPVGKLPVDSPVCFTKSDNGQLWLVCDPKPDEMNVLVF